MKYVISRYDHNLAWLSDYTDDFVLYDRSEKPLKGAIIVPNLGSDIADKLKFIIDNYDNLPEIICLIKANLFDYIKPREFEKIKDNKTFTPILSMEHHTYMPVCYYKDNIYWEINNLWFTTAHPCKEDPIELMKLLGIYGLKYVPFAPGSGYILPRETILKHPKSFYEKLRSYLDWSVYPGEAMIIERGLYTLWRD